MKKICNKMKQINKLGTKSVISKEKKIVKKVFSRTDLQIILYTNCEFVNLPVILARYMCGDRIQA